jgi:hypothetical protein
VSFISPPSRFRAALSLLLVVAPPLLAYEQGFNCGDNRACTTPDGLTYAVDREYSPLNRSGRIGGETHRPGFLDSVSDIGGTEAVTDQRLLGSWASGWQEYRFDLPNGQYVVHLHFMENQFHWRGLRAFRLNAEGSVLVDSLDIFSRVDRRYGLSLRRLVQVEDGRLNVVASAQRGEAILSAIYIDEMTPDWIPPSTPIRWRAVASYNEVVLLLDRDWERDELGIHIWRADLTTGGPFERITREPAVFDRWRDRGLDPTHQYSYQLVAVDASGNLSNPSPAVEVRPLAFAESSLPVHGFDLLEEDFVTLYTDRGRDLYLPAYFWSGGEEWPDAEIRLRGNTTRGLIKKNYKFRTDRDHLFPGVRRKLNLQSEWQMPSPLREKIGFDLFAWAGALSSAADYVNLQRQEEYAGLYVDIEQVDDFFLQGRDLDGTIWRADSEVAEGDFRRHSDITDYYPIYTLEYGGFSDYEELDRLFAIVNETSAEEFRTRIREVLDVDAFMRFYASEAVLANWDHVVHNYFLFRDAGSGLFYFSPWDVQLGWDNPHHPIDYGTREHRWFFIAFNRLYDRLMHSPQYARIYAVTLARLIQNELSVEVLQGAISADYETVSADVHRDMYKQHFEDASAFEAELPYLLDFTEARHEDMLEQLADFAPPPEVNLFLNEIVRWNQNGIRDEAGEEEPWVELHNFGNEIIDIGGMGLSNDRQNPFAWRIPTGVEIEPDGHLLFWLDGEPEDGPLHSSFAVDPDLRLLYLADRTGSPVDTLLFEHTAFLDLADARVPDGGEEIYPVAVATPAGANLPEAALEVEMSGAAEHLPGDLATVELTLRNHTALGFDLRVALSIDTGSSVRDLGQSTLSLAAGEVTVRTLALEIPLGVAPLKGALLAEVTTADDLFLSRAELPVRIWDATPAHLVINEVMADNDTTVADENGQFDDWIEIVNPTGQTISLAGLYLSDDGGDPTRWPFPPLKIAAGEYIVVWCDDDEEQGPLHASFKLSAAGEEVGIYDLDVRDNARIDFTTFAELGDDRVWGRHPDTDGEFTLLPFATPGAANP